ncbi:integrase arm-type DNA-binding domain-containing protein [Sulfurimonas sp. NWX79]|uniref:tyrosine-type recombinase/integrase n=1 Tax=Sulfurimonas sp. NWX79 TaxID=2925412 RepID=UPI003204A75E
MARVIPLTATQIKQAKAQSKDYKMSDGGGLYLLVTKAGGKHWKLKYRIDGKEKKLSLGAYPDITLQRARELRETNRKIIADGIDPAAKKQQKKIQTKQEFQRTKFTFKFLAEQLHEERLKSGDISEVHYNRIITAFKNDAYPVIGDKHISEVTTNNIKTIITTVADRGAVESAKKLYYAISKTFKTLITRDNPNNPETDYQITNQPAQLDLSDLVGNTKKKHYPTITDKAGIKNLLTSIKEYSGELSTKYALLLLAYTFVRPSNARLALWSEIDIKARQWVIPAKKMKTKDEFIVPLSDTVMDLIEEIRQYSSDSPYLFPSTKSKTTPLSDGALLGAVRRMGYTTEEFTPHGFRAMFSTIAHEKSPFGFEIIETQLAHSVGNSVSQAYNRAKYLNERHELMQWWSNYLDEIIN